MKTSVKRVVAGVAVSLLLGPLWASASFAASGDADLRAAAQQTLAAKMGEDAKDIQVDVKDGVANLTGWATGPAEESRARALVSRVPGVLKSYSSVRTWNTDGNL
jgi:hypothetical protein